jgi:hypothetical protein
MSEEHIDKLAEATAEQNAAQTPRELKIDLEIDPEFKALIQPLSESEYKSLEASLIKDGNRDPIVIWKGKNIIVDGHHRYEICKKNNIPFKTIEMEFPDRESVKRWILKNQFARRNLTKAGQKYLRGKTYESQKKSVGGDRGNQFTTMTVEMAEIAEQSNNSSEVQNEQLPQVPETKSTAEIVAEIFHVSESTVKRDAEFANAVDIINEKGQNIDRDIRSKILSGEIDMTIAEIIELAQEEDLEKQQRRISQALAEPKTAKAKKPEKPEKSPEEKRTFRFNNFRRELEYLTDEQLDTLSQEIAEIKAGRPTRDFPDAPDVAKPPQEEQTTTEATEEPETANQETEPREQTTIEEPQAAAEETQQQATTTEEPEATSQETQPQEEQTDETSVTEEPQATDEEKESEK